MPLSSRQSAAIARRKHAEQYDRDRAAEARRLTTMGLVLVDGLWSNATGRWFCLRCAWAAEPPSVRLATADLETTCTQCGHALRDTQE